MGTLKTICSNALIMLCCMIVFLLNTVDVSAETQTVGDWTYTISNGTASIAKYNGTSPSVTLPTSVTIDGITYSITKVDEFAFEGNATLKQVFIPEKIDTLGRGVFKNCTALSYVEIQGDIADCTSNSRYGTNSVFCNTGTNTESFTVKFTEGVTRIPSYLFATEVGRYNDYGAHVTKVVMADSIKEIGVGAFYNCIDLKEMQISANVSTIESEAFKNCRALESVVFPSKVTKIDEYAFEECVSLKTVELPESKCIVGRSAFRNCTSLSSVVIKGDIADCTSSSTYGTNSVFCNTGTNADSFTVKFTEGVTRIPAYLFATEIGRYSDYGAHVTKVEMADSIKEIGAYAFYNCEDLKEMQISANVSTIGSGAFRNCQALESMVFPSKVTKIDEYAFEECTSLKTVELPENDCIVGRGAFKNCTSLSSVVIKGNIADCDSSSAYGSSYSVFFNTGTDADSFTVKFTEGVTRIPAYLFATEAGREIEYGAHITKIILPGTVTEIGAYAFYSCADLTEIELITGVKTIGESAFAYASSLEKATVGPNVTTIGKNAFAECDELSIYGYSGSEADVYAAANSIPFVSMGYSNGWVVIDGAKYWYEGGVRQGMEGRGKEIYDSGSDAWYWLDAPDGKMAAGKDVYQESLAGIWGDIVGEDGQRYGKWVRYDENGHMIKGWQETNEGRYYFDETFGTMAKGYATIDGEEFYFNADTGILENVIGSVPENGWKSIGGSQYWYENYVRQGYSVNQAYRGKEIYDPVSNAWYWLDNIDGGRKAVSKDVYQESLAGDWGDIAGEDGQRYGKWVRYDENGHMIKGWQYTDNGTYFFDYTYGTMAKGSVTIDGQSYYFDESTGVLQ